MNNLLFEILRIIASYDIKIYHSMVLTCKNWSMLVKNSEEYMNLFTKEIINDSDPYNWSICWGLPNKNCHRGDDLPARIYIDTEYVDIKKVVYVWLKNGKFYNRKNGDANFIVCDNSTGEIIITKSWYANIATLRRDKILPSMERCNSDGKILKRQWYDGIVLLKSQDEEGTKEYSDGRLVKIHKNLTL